MATDGVKIIDGDSAFDIYATFTDAYNAGADREALLEMYEQDKQLYSFEDAEYEICVTVYALAFWEIGEITPEIINEVKAVIAKGAGVADWTEQVGQKAGKARQKALDELWQKINKPNNKIRKRKKYATIKNLLLTPGDVLTFRFPDGKYGLTVVADVMQYRGDCDYMLCRTTFSSTEKPTMENLAELHIYGSLVPSGHSGIDYGIMEKLQSLTVEEMKSGGVDRLMAEMTASMTKLKMPWVLTIEHKRLLAQEYIGSFEKIGNIPLRSNCGSSSEAPTYSDFCENFYTQSSEHAYNAPHMPETGEFTVDELLAQPYQK